MSTNIYKTYGSTSLIFLLVWILSVATLYARPLGPDPVLSFEGLVDYQVNADTLLQCSQTVCGGGSDCIGLDQSSIEIINIPNHPELRLLHARLSWVGSMGVNGIPDAEITLQTPDTNRFTVIADEALSESFTDGMPQCEQLIPLICPEAPFDLSCDLKFYAQHADITQVLANYQASGGALNGTWSIADVTTAGSSINDPATAIASIGSLSIGAWSLMLVYESPDLTPKKIYYYQGLELNEGVNRQIFPQGFVAPANPILDLSLMVLEGDLGITGDQLLVNGRQISDECNPVNNVFNSTVNSNGMCRRNVTGVDLDRFSIANAIEAGDEEAQLELVIPRGDGLFTAGEQLFTHWMILSFDHLLPDFDTLKPEKEAIPPSESIVTPGDLIEYRIQISNRGQAPATGVKLTDVLSPLVDYVPGSLRINLQPLPDGLEDSLSLETGLLLTELPQVGSQIDVGENYIISFEVRVTMNASINDVIENIAYIEADLIEPIMTNTVIHQVGMNGIEAGAEAGVEAGAESGVEAGAESGVEAGVEAGTAGSESSNTAGWSVDDSMSGNIPIAGDMLAPESNTMTAIEIDGGNCGPGTRFNRNNGLCESVCGEGLRWDATCDPGLCVQESAPACNGAESSEADQGGCQSTIYARTWIYFIFILCMIRIHFRKRNCDGI